MISYKGLETRLKERGVRRSELPELLGLSSRTVAKIGRGEKLSRAVIGKLADFLSCRPEDICREISDNPVLQRLRDEKSAGISGGIYHEVQVRMTYNSNRIEGSRLSEDQTRLIFETNTLDAGDGVSVDDLLETVHHFRAIDFVIDNAEEALTPELIKRLHFILKHDTSDSRLDWFAVGDYKKRGNFVGGRETAAPDEVGTLMDSLLAEYAQKDPVTLEDVVRFHVCFERIHPFQDGNGRVGRLIALKECLKHGITPFIIEDRKKLYYYRGLAEWDRERGFLMGTVLDAQDTFNSILSRTGV